MYIYVSLKVSQQFNAAHSYMKKSSVAVPCTYVQAVNKFFFKGRKSPGRYSTLLRCVCTYTVWHENIGGEFNLVDWRMCEREPPN